MGPPRRGRSRGRQNQSKPKAPAGPALALSLPVPMPVPIVNLIDVQPIILEPKSPKPGIETINERALTPVPCASTTRQEQMEMDPNLSLEALKAELAALRQTAIDFENDMELFISENDEISAKQDRQIARLKRRIKRLQKRNKEYNKTTKKMERTLENAKNEQAVILKTLIDLAERAGFEIGNTSGESAQTPAPIGGNAISVDARDGEDHNLVLTESESDGEMDTGTLAGNASEENLERNTGESGSAREISANTKDRYPMRVTRSRSNLVNSFNKLNL